MKTEDAVFYIADMDCPMEENIIRDRLGKMREVQDMRFDLFRRMLTVSHTPGSLPEITKELESLGMGARQITAGSDALVHEAPKIPWRKLALAGVLAFFSEIFDVVPGIAEMGGMHIGGYGAGRILSLLLAVAAIAIAGLETYKKGWLAITSLNLNINALMAVAVTGAVLIGQFPEAAAVIVLFNISEAIEAHSMDHARKAIASLMELAPEKAVARDSSGQWHEYDIHDVPVGSVIRVRPGEKIALDGIVVSGESTVNQASITGESMPVEKRKGDFLYAGTLNGQGSLEYESTAAAGDTTLARIIHAVEEAQATRAPIQRFVDVFARYYTPSVFFLAILVAVFLPLFWHVPPLSAIYEGLVILVIGCPCALVISTPVTIVSGLASATRSGILIKGGAFMEEGRLLRCLALDKTGTITFGKPAVTDFINIGPLPRDESLRLAVSLAGRSDHPVSLAMAGKFSHIPALEVFDFHALPGAGVAGKIAGKDWKLGSSRLLAGYANRGVMETIRKLEEQGKSVAILIGPDGPVAICAVADTIRPSSVEAMRELKELGVATVMLTGDNLAAARNIAAQAGVDQYRAGLLPEEKQQAIASLKNRYGKTGMAGDGINDAPALALADISFSMARGGSDTAIETADVALMDDDLRKIPRFIRLSRSVYTILMENILLALGIKAVFFVLAITGNATMWMAVFADVGAALLVVTNGLRTMRK